MAVRRPLVLVDGVPAELPVADSLAVGQASIDASALTAPRTFSLPDQSGTASLGGGGAVAGPTLGKMQLINSMRVMG